MIQKGYFVITDISGYTSYLSKSELDHANEVLKSLFDAQIETIKPPLTISNFQGDAILSYVPEASILAEQTLIELIEDIYFSFARKRELMQFNTNCTCNACKNISGLDLKMCIHYGDFILQQVGGRGELMGSDVILTHRMMKNKVIEQTGVQAYALFTEAAAKRLGLEALCTELQEHKESYEHVGEVNMFVHDLEILWEREKEKTRNVVTREEAWVSTELEIAAPPAVVWEYITKVDIKIQWAGMSSGERTDNLGGRVQEGASFHCSHEELDFRYKVVDWAPFKYYTCYETGINGLVYYNTYHLTPTDKGTLFANYVRKPESGPAKESKNLMQGAWHQVFAGLKTLVEDS